MSLKRMVSTIVGLILAASTVLGVAAHAADKAADAPVYDESSYTEYVENTMKKLDRLYLEFCGTCGVDAAKAVKARQEFLTTVRDLMQYMNGRFDRLDPKTGGALSATETLVSIHVLTMLVDILTATQLEHLADHPYNQ
ncbi:MAG: hypothetical protein WBQ78_07775 [Gammaproteobacteria bacterium]